MTRPTFERILVVEDNPRLRRTLTDLLEPSAQEVRACCRLGAAEDMIRDWKPDLMFLDFRLPDGDARELLRRMGSDTPLPRVVGMSAVALPSESFELGELGVLAFLEKPLTPETVEAAMDKVSTPADVSPHLRAIVGAVGLQEVEEQVRLTMVEHAFVRAGSVRGAARLLKVSRQFLQHAVRKIRDHSPDFLSLSN